MVLRYYAPGAPYWWRYQLVSLGNNYEPPRNGRYWYRLLIDNGMFAFYKTGSRPSLDKWLARLNRYIKMIDSVLKPDEIRVILPDWLGDPGFTAMAARHERAKKLCKDYVCFASVHSSTVGDYVRVAEEMGTIEHVMGLAAPLKINCVKKRRPIKRCQVAIVQQVCGVARRLGLQCHGLGALLDPKHLQVLEKLGMGSFDSGAWIRVNKRETARPEIAGIAEAKTKLFTAVLLRLKEGGVVLEE